MTQKATYLVVEGVGSNTSASGGVAWTYGMPTNHGTVASTYEWHGGFGTGAGLVEMPDIGGAEVDPYSARYAGGSSRVQIVWDDLARSLWSNRPNVATAFLGTAITKTDTTLDIDGTINGAAPSASQDGTVVFIGEEAILLGSYSAGSFTGCTRAYYSTTAAPHIVDEMVFTSNPMRATRGAWIYELDISTGVSTQKWQGFVRPRSPYSVSGKVLTVELVDDIAATSQARINRDYRVLGSSSNTWISMLSSRPGGLDGYITMGLTGEEGADVRVNKTGATRPHEMAFQVGDEGAVWAQRQSEATPRAKLATGGERAIRGGNIFERFGDERAYEIIAVDRERDMFTGFPGIYKTTLHSSTRDAQYPFHPILLSMAVLSSTDDTTPGVQGSGEAGELEDEVATITSWANIPSSPSDKDLIHYQDASSNLALFAYDSTLTRWRLVTTYGDQVTFPFANSGTYDSNLFTDVTRTENSFAASGSKVTVGFNADGQTYLAKPVFHPSGGEMIVHCDMNGGGTTSGGFIYAAAVCAGTAGGSATRNAVMTKAQISSSTTLYEVQAWGGGGYTATRISGTLTTSAQSYLGCRGMLDSNLTITVPSKSIVFAGAFEQDSPALGNDIGVLDDVLGTEPDYYIDLSTVGGYSGSHTIDLHNLIIFKE